MKLSIQIEQKVLFCILIMFVTNFIHSQQLSIELNTGLSHIKYNIQDDKGESSPNFGGSIGVNYTYNLNDMWGVLGGVHLGMYASNISLADGTYFSNEVDDTNTAFRFKVNMNQYQENQKMYTLNVPILVQFSNHAFKSSKLYVLGGVKICLPISQSSQSEAKSLNIHGYYPNSDVNVTNLPQHGFGTLSNWEDKKTPVKLSTTVALSIQTGLDFMIKGKLFYAGVYFDYGLNDIAPSDKKDNIIEYNSKLLKDTKSNGVSNSKLIKNTKLSSFGLSLKMFFNKNKGGKVVY